MKLQKLRGIRVAKGYTQHTLAKKLGMSTKTYNRKELGIIEFNRQELLSLIEVLGLTANEVNEIFFGNRLTKCINSKAAGE